MKFNMLTIKIPEKVRTISLLFILFGFLGISFGHSYLPKPWGDITTKIGAVLFTIGLIESFYEWYIREEFIKLIVDSFLGKKELRTMFREEKIVKFMENSLKSLLGNELGEAYSDYIKNSLVYKKGGFWNTLHVKIELFKSYNVFSNIGNNQFLDEKTRKIADEIFNKLYYALRMSVSYSTKAAMWNWKEILDDLIENIEASDYISSEEKKIAIEELNKIKKNIKENKYYIFIIHQDNRFGKVLPHRNLHPSITSLYSISLIDFFNEIKKRVDVKNEFEIEKYILSNYFITEKLLINNRLVPNSTKIFLKSIGAYIDIYEFEITNGEELTITISKILPIYRDDTFYYNYLPLPVKDFIFEFDLKDVESEYIDVIHSIQPKEPTKEIEEGRIMLRVDGWILPPSPVFIFWYPKNTCESKNF